MTTYPAESFFRAKINASILKATACPITVPLSKLPSVTNGLLTMSPNSEYEEICEYNNPNPLTMTIDIIKRWIKPSSLLLTTDWVDYNNTTYQFDHTQNDIIRGDVNHIHLNQGIGNTVLATNLWVWISKLSVAAVNPSDPIVVWDNDPRLTRSSVSARVNITTATTTTTTYTLWFRPKKVRIRATTIWNWPYSESETFDWGTTFTTYFRWDGAFLMGSQVGSAVILRSDWAWTSSAVIATCTITATWFTLSAPLFVWYTQFNFIYEAIS